MSLFEIFSTYQKGFLQGLGVTLELCFVVWVVGIVLGTLVGVLGSKYSKSIGALSKLFSHLISGVPVLVLLYWLYYPVQQQFEVDIDAFTIAAFAFSFINVFMVADLVRNAIDDLPKQYIMAAKVTGLDNRTILRRIQIPLVFKQLLGPVLLVQISMLHNSIFASLINVDEIFRQIQRINAMVYKPIELYSALAIFFVIITVPLKIFAYYLKRKYTQDISEH